MSTLAVVHSRQKRPMPFAWRFIGSVAVIEGALFMLANAPWSVIGGPVAFVAAPFALYGLYRLLSFGLMNAALWSIDRALTAYNESREQQERTRRALQESLTRNIERAGEAA